MPEKKLKYENISASYDVGVARQYGVNCAVLLNKLNYLSKYTQREDGFCWRTAKELEEELGLSRRQQNVAVEKLVKAGVIEVKNTYIIGTQIKCKHFKILVKSENKETKKSESNKSVQSDCNKMSQSESNKSVQSDCNKMSQSESNKMSQSVYNNKTVITKHNTLSISNDIDKGQAPETFGNPEINNLFLKFEEIVGIKVSSKVKSNRFACKRLLQKHGQDVIEKVLFIVVQANSDRYAPTITDFIELEQKWNRLGVWWRKKQIENNNNGILEV